MPIFLSHAFGSVERTVYPVDDDFVKTTIKNTKNNDLVIINNCSQLEKLSISLRQHCLLIFCKPSRLSVECRHSCSVVNPKILSLSS